MSLKALSPYILLLAAGGAFTLYYNGGLPGFSQNDEPLSDITASGSPPALVLAADSGPESQRSFRQPSANQPAVDESAIYYYASQGDRERMQAEIARLKALYPNWTPPANPEAGPDTSDPELQRLWALFSEGRYPEVRDAIAGLQQRNPEWQPPADLLTQLGGAEARLRLLNAAQAQQWATVLRVATDHSGMLVCANMDVLWSVAEAFAKTDKAARGLDVYEYILTNCTNPAERLATVEKASALLPLKDAEQLIAQYPSEDFGSVSDTLLRRKVGEAAQDPAQTLSPADITRMEQLVAATTDTPDDAMLLAFYLYRHQQAAKAAQLFKTALDRNGGAKAAEGYVLALGAQDLYLEAEPIAYEWQGSSPDNLKAYLDIMTALLSQEPPPRLDQSIIHRLVPVVSKAQSSTAGQALGWYAYNTGQVPNAEQWFVQALKWDRESEPAAFGLAVARQRLKNQRGFMAVVNAWRDRSQRIADLVDRPNRRERTSTRVAQAEAPVLDASSRDDIELFGETAASQRTGSRPSVSRPPVALQSAYVMDNDAALDIDAGLNDNRPIRQASRQAAAPRGNTRQCASSSSLNGLGGLSSGSALSLGWCLMTLDRPMEAIKAFEAVQNKSTNATQRQEAAYGKSLAYLRSGLTNKAAISASEARMTPTRQRELSVALLSQQALAAFNAGRYTETLFILDARSKQAPEQTDLMMIRGWSYFHLARFDEATRMFKAVQRTGVSSDASAGLTAIAERLGRVRY